MTEKEKRAAEKINSNEIHVRDIRNHINKGDISSDELLKRCPKITKDDLVKISSFEDLKIDYNDCKIYSPLQKIELIFIFGQSFR